MKDLFSSHFFVDSTVSRKQESFWLTCVHLATVHSAIFTVRDKNAAQSSEHLAWPMKMHVLRHPILLYTRSSVTFKRRHFDLGCPSLCQVKWKRRRCNNMMRVNVCICLPIMMSKQEISLKQDSFSYFVPPSLYFKSFSFFRSFFAFILQRFSYRRLFCVQGRKFVDLDAS